MGQCREVTAKNPCPICGKPDWCFIFPDGAIGCRRENRPGSIEKVDRNGEIYWLYPAKQGNEAAPDVEDLPSPPSEQAISPELKHNILYDFLSMLSLSEKHRENLLRRGLPEDEIKTRLYKSVPGRERTSLVSDLEAKYGQIIYTTPGFHKKQGKNGRLFRSCAGKSGFYIPICDPKGLITGLLIRLDKPEGKNKYIHFTSRHHGGPGARNTPHFPTFNGPKNIFRVTEGPLKADIATVKSGIYTIGIPGVNAWRPVIEALMELKPEQVRVAFDADFADPQKPQVANNLLAFLCELQNQGFNFAMEIWDPKLGKGVDDLLAAGHSPEVIEGEAAIKYVEEVIAQNKGKALPQIIVAGRPFRIISDEILESLQKSNDPPEIFVRAGSLVRIVLIPDKNQMGEIVSRPVIKQMDEAALRGLVARRAECVKPKGDALIPCPPPLDIVRDILARGHWPFPLLQGVVQCPIIRKDGTIISSPGYDVETCLYYQPEGNLEIPPLPEKPEPRHIQQGADLLNEIICDFPLVDEASRANALAAIITPVLREIIHGPVPMAVITKPQQGTGASLLASVIACVATGKPAQMISPPEGKEREVEWKKLVTGIVLEGRSIAIIDNFEGVLRSTTMGALLTCSTWSDRILGSNEITSLPHRICWVLTGNNVRLAGDLPRRCYAIKLDAKKPRPWLQDRDFKHPKLLEWVTKMRGEILAAILTLARAWILAGRPVPQNLIRLGGFESWTETLGGILSFAGIGSFLQNLEEVYQESEDDEGWEAFLAAWFDVFGEGRVTTSKVKEALEKRPDFADCLPAELDLADKGFTRRLGHALKRYANKSFSNGLRIEKSSTVQRAIAWRVRKNMPTGSSEDVSCLSFMSSSPKARVEKSLVANCNHENLYIEGPEQNSLNTQNSPLRNITI